MSVTTSMSRWIPSGRAGRLEKRELDQALITASLAAHRAARCRAADELLSAASRRSPGVNVSANTVPGRVHLLGEIRYGNQIDAYSHYRHGSEPSSPVRARIHRT